MTTGASHSLPVGARRFLGRLLSWKVLGPAFLVLAGLDFGLIDLGDRIHVFILVYAAISAIFIRIYKGNEPLDIFSPAIGFTVLLFLYSLSSASFAETMGMTYEGDTITPDDLRQYYVCCVAGLLGVATGILYAQRTTNDPRKTFHALPSNCDNDFCYRKMILLSIVLGIALIKFLSPHFDILHIPSYAERALDLRIERQQDPSAGLMEVFTVILPVTIIFCAGTVALFRKSGRYLYVTRAILVGLMALYVTRNTLAGWRGLVIASLVIPVIYYHYRVRPIRFWPAALLGFVVYVFMNALSLMRSTSDPLEMLKVLFENMSENRMTFLNLSSSSELMVGTNLMRLISGIGSGETTFTYGSSILSELLVYIPRTFYPGRPLSISEQFVELFYPGMLEAGGGLGFFILQEGYWAFGTVGVFLFMFLYSAFVQRIYSWFRARMQYDLVALGYSSVYCIFILYSIRSGIIGNFKQILISMIPFLVIAWLPVPRGLLMGRPRKRP